jgi:anti-anti-sigma factor
MGMVHELSLTSTRESKKTTVRIRGELDFASLSKLVAFFEDFPESYPTECQLDCSEVTFIDSEACKFLIRLQRDLQRRNTTLILKNCSRPVARVFALLGLDYLLSSGQAAPKPIT